MVSDKLSLKNSKINKGCLGSLTFLTPSNFAVFDSCYFLCYYLQRAENKWLKLTNSFNFVQLNLCIRWRFLRVNLYANEQKCKLWRQQRFATGYFSIMHSDNHIYDYYRLSLYSSKESFQISTWNPYYYGPGKSDKVDIMLWGIYEGWN